MSRRQLGLITLIAAMVALCAILYRNSTLPVYRTMTTSTTPRSRVIVVGSGLAGLSAAHAALTAGASVHVLERAQRPGGNSIKASSGINGAGTLAQAVRGIVDTSFYADTVKSAGARFQDTQVDRAALVKKLVDESASAVAWLSSLGVDLSIVAPLGGHSVPRTHRGPGKPPGAAIISTLLETLGKDDKFTLSTGASVTRLLTSNNRVTGVEYTRDGATHTEQGNVVVAAGGFAGDADGLLARYRPDLAGLPSTNEANPASHHLLSFVNARLVDMDSVQVHPTGFVDPADPGKKVKFLAGEMLRGEGGILLRDGQRFVNELETRENVSRVIMEAPEAEVAKQWDVTLLLDPGAAAAARSHLGFYEWKGLMRRVKLSSLNPESVATVKAYAAQVASNSRDPFGRPSYGQWTLTPDDTAADVWIGKVTPITHFTMGGAAIDTHARILSDEGVVQGLYAAGEITGGIHGDNRLGGSSLLECVVYGRTAGREAAEFA